MSEWTDELKAEIIEKYQEAGPTPENSMDIVQDLADEYEKSVNGVRLILSKANVYIKKTPAAKTGKKAEGSGGDTASKRVPKKDSIDALAARIGELGGEVDSEILDKLTGKAAIYLLKVINTVVE